MGVDRLDGTDLDLGDMRRSERTQALHAHDEWVTLAGSYGTASGDFRASFDLLANEPAHSAVERLISGYISLFDLRNLLLSALSGYQVGKLLLDPALSASASRRPGGRDGAGSGR